MTSSYDSTWDQPSSPWARQPTKKPTSMYSNPTQQDAGDSTSGMYSQPNGLFDFSNLSSGGQTNLAVGSNSLSSIDPNQTGMYQAYKGAEAQKFGDLTGLAGTGLQTRAQTDVAGINADASKYNADAANVVGLGNLDFKKSLVPYLQQIINGGLGGGNSSANALISSVTNAANPVNTEAAINAAEAYTKQAADRSLQNQYGQYGSANSPQAIAARQAAGAAQAGGFQEAKRKIETDAAQQRIANLSAALSGQTQSMNPVYSLLQSLIT